ncbi:MAG: hypothetical protein WCK83_11290 [Burkholderiales bacterium]
MTSECMDRHAALAMTAYHAMTGNLAHHEPAFVTARSAATRQSMSAGISAWIATAFGLAMTRGRGLAMTKWRGLAMTNARVMACFPSLAMTTSKD